MGAGTYLTSAARMAACYGAVKLISAQNNSVHFLKLSDGKTLCYAEYGAPEGRPIMLFHGNPGSRLAWGAMPGSPFHPNSRLIAPDRPGFGRTEFKKRALERWPQDIAELADHLHIENFTLFAPSGGAPYALACAWKIPERLNAVGLFGALGPNTPKAIEGVIPSLKVLWKVARPLQWLIRLQMRALAMMAKRNPLKLASRIRDLELSGSDKAIFDREDIQTLFETDFPEAYRQNGIGSAYDATIPATWPIPLHEIKTRIRIWHAEHDQLVGNMPVYLAQHLQRAELKTLPGQGHLWILDHMPEVLGELLEGVEP